MNTRKCSKLIELFAKLNKIKKPTVVSFKKIKILQKAGKKEIVARSLKNKAFTIFFLAILFVPPFQLFGDNPNSKSYKQELLAAVHENDIPRVKELLALGADINFCDLSGYTLLMSAVEHGYPELVEVLLEAGADPEMRDDYGSGVFSFIEFPAESPAKLEVSLRILDLLLESGMDVDEPTKLKYEKTLLMKACESHSSAAVEYLLEKGANAKAKNADGKSPLNYLIPRVSSSYSCEKREVHEILVFLERFGAVPADYAGSYAEFLKNLSATGDAKALLSVLKRPDCVQFMESLPKEKDLPGNILDVLLVYLLCDIHGTDSEIREAIVTLVKMGADVQATDEGRDHPVFITKNRTVILTLLDCGLPVGITSDKGESIIHFAIRSYNTELMDTAFIQKLVSLGCEVNQKDNDGETPLMLAYDSKVVSLLLKLGADPNLTDNYGNTALHYHAFLAHDTGVFQLMLKVGASLEAVNDAGETPFLGAVDYASIGLLLYLLDLGADPLARDADGLSALDYFIETYYGDVSSYDLESVKADELDFVVTLLGRGVKPDTTGYGGTSVLYKFFDADPNAKSSMTKAILEASSDENIAQVRQDLKTEDMEDIEDNAEALTIALLFPLVICGVDIWMREGIYANDPHANWMAVLNSSLTLSAVTGLGSALASVIIYWTFFSDGYGNSLDETIGAFIVGITFFTLGAIGGGIIGLLPDVSMAFVDSDFLYYTVPALSVVVSAGVIFSILDEG